MKGASQVSTPNSMLCLHCFGSNHLESTVVVYPHRQAQARGKSSLSAGIAGSVQEMQDDADFCLTCLSIVSQCSSAQVAADHVQHVHAY